MPPAPIPAVERHRLAAIRSYPALDGQRDAWTDECARIAATLTGCPIAIVSIVEERRQWFRGCLGLGASSTSRDAAFCSYTILSRNPLIVPDATRDPRFRDNPLVVGEPGIRFYAGVPLIDQHGMALGSLCVIHTRPHEINAEQLRALRSLAGLVLQNITQSRDLVTTERSLEAVSAEREAMIAARSQLEAEIAARDLLVRELEQARQVADAANRAKSAFLANISHEIRTPMTAILGYADLLAGTDGVAALGPEERGRAIETIQRNGHHLLNIINDLLDISKIEAGKLAVENLRTPLREMLDQIIIGMHDRVERGAVEIVVEQARGVPSHIMTDPTRLRQILINLIGNAIKFTSRGSVRVRVLTLGGAGGSSRPAELRIEVMDTGIGMTREQLTRLFRPFSQADPSHARRFGGTGLGLSISCKLAECMGGRIEAESELGHGSRFVLTLPLRVCAGEEGGDLAASGSEGVAGAAESVRPLAGRRILVVEDGPDNQRLIGFHLRRSGALVETAGNGALGVRAAVRARDAGQPFDVILMDIQMPELDGYGATSRLRAEGMTTPIVALTAHAMDGERERCLAAGCDDYLTKPIDYPSLIGCCVRWIDSREHDRHAA